MRRMFAFLVAIVFSAAQSQAQNLEPFGLQGMNVTSLAISPEDYSITWNTYLFAGTDSLGVFARDLSRPDSSWSFFGLRGKKITALNFHHTGAGPGEFNWPFAGVEPSRTAGDSALLFELVDGGNWVVADNGMDRNMPSITAIAGIFYSGHEPPQPLFAGGEPQIYRSSNAGASWEKVLDVDTGLNVLMVSQRGWGGEVWAGGGAVGYSFLPFIAKSKDRGATWESVSPNYPGNEALSLAIHPRSADTVYAGLHGVVIKTTDGGNTWGETSLRNPIATFCGLAIDPVNPEHVYAGGDAGRDPFPRFFVLYESLDGGATWNQVIEINVKRGITSLAVDPHKRGVLYIATRGDGVWRYPSVPKIISIPEDFAAIQAAIDAARHGDTLLVGPGTYMENINFHGKNILLKSRQGPEATIIDGNRNGSVVTFADGENSKAFLEGFTLRNGSGTAADSGLFGGGIFGGGIYCKSSSPTIVRNVIVDNEVLSVCGSFGGGIAVIGESFPIIEGNRIKSNGVISLCDALVNHGGGAFISGKSAPVLRKNTVSQNWADYGGGIAIVDSAQPAIEGNTITQNQNSGIFVAETALPRIAAMPNTGNDIAGNSGLQLLRRGDGETINAQYNYFGVCPPTEMEVAPLSEFDTEHCSKFSVRNYFPLEVGNRWRFETIAIAPYTESIIDTVRIARNLFFRFDKFRGQSQILLRLRDDNKLTWRFDPMSVLEHLWVDFDAQVGDRWELVTPQSEWTVELQSKTDTVDVPAGTFTNCYRFYFDGGPDNSWVEWYAPGIGPVKRIFYGYVVIEQPLWSAVIHDIPVSVDEPPVDQTPKEFALHSNYPNPFNASTVMRFELPKPALVKLQIYNLLGQKVRTLLSEWKAAGQHRLQWDGRDDAGVELPGGIYLCNVIATSTGKSESSRQIRKMVLVK